MHLRYTGLPHERFAPLFEMSDEELRARGVQSVTADSKPGFPCRITLEDAEPGERLLLLAYEYQPANSPYRAGGPIFVRRNAHTTYDSSEFPPVFRGRMLSIRAYDAAGMMTDAAIARGDEAEPVFARLLEDAKVSYLHVHNAARGCFSARVERA